MKKIINYSGIPGLILMAALVFMPFSCSKEAVKENPLTDNSSQLIKISGEDANAATKTTLDGLVTSWNGGDHVGIYCAQAKFGIFVGVINTPYTAETSAAISTFTGAMTWGTGTHNFYAYYPYNSSPRSSNSVLISLTASQTQSAGNSSSHLSALDFMVATPVSQAPGVEDASTSVNLRYNHVFTVLEFQIKGSGTLSKLKLTVPTSHIAFSAGTINLNQTPATGTAYTIDTQIFTTNQVVVTLTTPAPLSNTATSVYMVINPGTQTGNCSIGLSSDGTNYLTISKAAPTGGFSRGKKYVVPIDNVLIDVPMDKDGNGYNTVTIGTQTWMAENLKTTKYNDGALITHVTNNTTWKTSTTGAYCWYFNDEGINKPIYGALYNWYAVNTGKLCPTGWHVPTDDEWTTLTTYLGGVAVAGGKLKEAGENHWFSPNTAATNSSGFTALPGGYRFYYDGNFYMVYATGNWWSSTEALTSTAYYRSMRYDDSSASSGHDSKTFGYSVRCVRGM